MKITSLENNRSEERALHELQLAAIRLIPRRLGVTPEMIARHTTSLTRESIMKYVVRVETPEAADLYQRRVKNCARMRACRAQRAAESPVELPAGLKQRAAAKTGPMRQMGEVVARWFGLEWPMLFSRTRRVKYSWPRQVAHYLAYVTLGNSCTVAGVFFELDHGTILNSVKVVRARMETDKQVKATVAALAAEVNLAVSQNSETQKP